MDSHEYGFNSPGANAPLMQPVLVSNLNVSFKAAIEEKTKCR
jgi:hypothetical protein